MTTREPDAGQVRLDGIRVVLIEDDRDVLHVLTVLLEITGASVTPFVSVRAALDALDTTQPHVIVSDIGMPGDDGFVLVRRLRERESRHGGPRVPAIAMTGFVGSEDRDRLLAAGFQVRLGKPVERDELIAAVAWLAAGDGAS